MQPLVLCEIYGHDFDTFESRTLACRGLHCHTVKADSGKVTLELERVEDADLSAHIRDAVHRLPSPKFPLAGRRQRVDLVSPAGKPPGVAQERVRLRRTDRAK